MNILSDDQFRTLGFIAACNGSSYSPTAEQVLLWLNHPKPKDAEYRIVKRRPPIDLGFQQNLRTSLAGTQSALAKMVATMAAEKGPLADLRRFTLQINDTTSRELVAKAETVIDHMIRLTWLEKGVNDEGLRLTEIGKALLHDHEREATDEDVSVVVLAAHDPLAYPKLVGQLTNAGAGLLVDPYLKLEGLSRIVVSTQLTRLLVSVKTGRKDLSEMQTFLDNPMHGRQIEVRKINGLHDRVLLAEDQSVFSLGTSLNGVGRTTTIFTPVPAEAGATLRRVYEELWSQAELVGPQLVGDDQDDVARDAASGDSGASDEGGATTQDGPPKDGNPPTTDDGPESPPGGDGSAKD